MVDSSAMRDLIFRGLEASLSEDEQRIVSNVESMMAATSRSAARSTLDSDIVLVAVNERGEEERVRASSQVMQRMSSGFKGLLQECDCMQEIRMCAPAPVGQIKLHPIAAVRWVLEVLHAVDAHNAAGPSQVPSGPIAAHIRKSGLSSGPMPPLSLLLEACQIADCWDCPAVLSAAAHCVMDSAEDAMKDDFAGMARTTVKLLQLVPQGPPRAVEWSQLQEAIELSLARLIPTNRLASMLKHFDIEQVARVINLMEDEEIVLTSLRLEGPYPQGRGWAHELKKNGMSSEATPKRVHQPRRLNAQGFRVDKANGECRQNTYETYASQNRAELRASVRYAFAINLEVVPSSTADRQEAAQLTEMLTSAYGEAWRHYPDVSTATVNRVDRLRANKLGLYLANVGSAPALVKRASFWMQEEGKPTRRTDDLIEDRPLAFPIGQTFGWPRAFTDEDVVLDQLGRVEIGGTVTIDKLQRQFEVLARWQDLTKRRCARLPSRIVSSVKRLQSDARLVEPKVRLQLDVKFKGCFSQMSHARYTCKPSLTIAGARDLYSATMHPASDALQTSMTRYTTLRLDGQHGLVNRSVHALDRASALSILESVESVDGVNPTYAPTSERMLLRIAVDWATQPHRSKADVAEIMSRIHFAALPSFTLLHLDRNKHILGALRSFCDDKETEVAAQVQMGLAKQQRASSHELAELYQKLGLQWGEPAPHQADFVWTRFDEAEIQHLSTSKLFELTTKRARDEARLQQYHKETSQRLELLNAHVVRMDEF